MFALSYIISLFKSSPKKSDNSVSQPVNLTNSKLEEHDDRNKVQYEACAGEEREHIADSEESGLEYESATDGDTLVHSDESVDDDEDILDAPLLQLIIQADEKERKHQSSKEINKAKKQTSGDENQRTEKDIVRDKKIMIVYDKKKQLMRVDEDLNIANSFSRSNPKSNNESEYTNKKENQDGNYLKFNSEFVSDSLDFPTLSKTVLSMFAVDADQVSKNDDLIISHSMLNKPVAIVKPCQKSHVKIKDLHDGMNLLLKERKIYKENKEITKPKTITEKDVKEIEYKLKSVENETKLLIEGIQHVEENNKQMMTIVDEFEKTINQLVIKKEREEICQQIVMERIADERDDVVRDHQNVEKAFVDLNHKYERTRQVVTGLQMSEDNLKQSVEDLTNRYTEGEQKYQDAKTEAEDQLASVGITLEVRQRAKCLEIVRLTAQLRKAEMNVSSLEGEINQKTQENKELTTMCDDLLAKMETAS